MFNFQANRCFKLWSTAHKHCPLVKTVEQKGGFITSNFMFLICSSSAEPSYMIVLCFFYAGPRVKFSPRGPFGYSFVVLVRKGTEEVLTAACSYEALKVKLSCVLQYRFYPKISFKVKVLLRWALYFFAFRVSGKYQTMSFTLTVVLLRELEMVKQWQVFIKPLLWAHYNICNN